MWEMQMMMVDSESFLVEKFYCQCKNYLTYGELLRKSSSTKKASKWFIYPFPRVLADRQDPNA